MYSVIGGLDLLLSSFIYVLTERKKRGGQRGYPENFYQSNKENEGKTMKGIK